MNAKRERSLTVRVSQCVHLAPCLATSAARARLGVRLGDRRDQVSAQRPGLEPVQSACERVYTER